MAAPDFEELKERHSPVTKHAELGSELEHRAGDGDQQTNRYTAGPGIEIDEATDKRLFWKINRRILVIQLITYFCQSLDKGTLNFASIMGIKTDAHLNDATDQVSTDMPNYNYQAILYQQTSQYSWLGTILYIGILVGEYPQNYLLQKLPVAKLLAANIFCWGAVVACTAATVSFPPLMVVRLLLGVFESCVQPAMMLM